MKRKLTDREIKEFDEQAWKDQKSAIKCKILKRSIFEQMIKRSNYWRLT